MTIFHLLKTLIFCYKCAYAVLQPSSTKFSSELTLSKCILNISKSYFNTEHPIAVQTPGLWYRHNHWKDNFGEELLKLLSIDNYFSQLTLGYTTNIGTSLSNVFHPGSYIILIPRLKNIADGNMVLKMIRRIYKDARNPTAKTIICIKEPFQTIQEENYVVSSILTEAFAHRLTRVVLILPKSSHREYYIFSFKHSDQRDMCSNTINAIWCLDVWSSNKNMFLKGSNLFPKQDKLNLKNCRLNIMFTNYTPYIYELDRQKQGMIIDFFVLFCKKVHCILKWNVGDENFVHFPTFFRSTYQTDGYEMTYPFLRSDFVWFIPQGLEVPRWKSIALVFTPGLWVLVLITCTFGMFTFWLIQKSQNRSENVRREIGHTEIFTVLLTHLGWSYTNTYTSLVGVVFFNLWVFYCMLINTAYQAGLLAFIVSPGQLPAIETVEQLYRSNLNLTSYFEVINENSLSYPFCDWLYCYNNVAEGKTAVLDDVNFGRYNAIPFQDSRGRKLITSIEETVSTLYITMDISTFSYVFYNEFESLFHRYVSFGLLDRYVQYGKWLYPRRYLIPIADEVFSFSLFHLQSAFYLLLLGNTLSLGSFLLELCLFCKT
ncbi:Ionotropic receptor 398 [Blattella germanica]|nr:Ionotropic receptor 398 [Blattella germanica]